MEHKITVAEYIAYLAGHENRPVDLSFLLLPFGLSWGKCDKSDVLVGFIIEELYGMEPIQKIDCFDIVGIAYMLGHDSAEPFFSEAPLVIASLMSVDKQGTKIVH